MQGFLFILIIGCIIAFIGHRLNDNGAPTKAQNENEVELAVISIETAAEFVRENHSILKCNQITMWQYGETGEGFTVEFYGFDIVAKPMIQRMLTDVLGSWEVWEDTQDEVLHITYTGRYTYKGVWNNFNKAVWNEVERKHPDWKIKKPYSHKYILYV